MTKTERRERWTRSVLSGDLRRTLGEQGLLRLALDAVQSLDLQQVVSEGGKPVQCRPQMMLTLLTYCYSATIYGSRDIEYAIAEDRTVRYICARARPDWQTIRRFRRQFREALRQCLSWVFKQTWALKFDEGEADYVGYQWFESDLLDQMNAEVMERLGIAALLDGADSD